MRKKTDRKEWIIFWLGSLLFVFFLFRAHDRPGFREKVPPIEYYPTVLARDGMHYPGGEPVNAITLTLVHLGLEKPLMFVAVGAVGCLLAKTQESVWRWLRGDRERRAPVDDGGLPTNRPQTWEE